MRKAKAVHRGPWCPIFVFLGLVCGCAHNVVPPEGLKGSSARAAELQKSIANLNIRLEELNNSVFILQEATKANREAIRKIKHEVNTPSIIITPSTGPVSSAYAPLPQGGESTRAKGYGGYSSPAYAPSHAATAKTKSGSQSGELRDAVKHFQRGHYGLAAYDLAAILSRRPSQRDAVTARYYLAESYFKLGDHAQAIREYEVLLGGNPGSFGAKATLRSAQCHQKLGRLEKSRRIYSEVITRYPNTAEAKIAAAELSRL